MSEDPTFVSVDELPDDPLKMPPPYWRSGGAVLHIQDALVRLGEHLHELLPVHRAVDKQIEDFYEKYPEEDAIESNAVMDEFSDICDPLWELEHQVQLNCQTAVLMSAIHAEEVINRFCVFNLPKELVESLERLSAAEKLTAAASHLGQNAVRSTAAYAAVSGLATWRNAFAHGHCVDRPVKTLRHNHLISPKAYPGVPDSVAQVIKHVSGYEKFALYLAKISKNPYTSVSDAYEFTPALNEVKKFKFKGGPMVYDISLSKPAAKRRRRQD